MTDPTAGTTAETTLHVGGAAPYDVVVGSDLAHHLPGMVGSAAERVALVVDTRLQPFADDLVETLGDREVLVFAVPEGEECKSVEVAAEIWNALGDEGFTRSDVIVTLGGGATTDLGGFVAATWLRGVRVVHVPTTLLGMVDAAVGGKTAVNTESGKNLVGAFHEPAGVLCDLSFLRTLAAEELVSGLAEVLKCGFVADPEILRIAESVDPGTLTVDDPALRELVERAIRVKVDVVVEDLRETGGRDGHPGREVLNYGHTLGHAIEQVSGYTIRHGEAVALGCVYVAELARLEGRIGPELVQRHRDVLGRFGLPTAMSGPTFEDLLELMRVDKKARGSQLRFVVLDDVARPAVLAGPSEEHLRAAYDALQQGDGEQAPA
ncbi:3-dehydroquinate synthase [Nocardioides marmotae]|uniref:3-dehydroquinate synthase n=1 Tax=Nocardioides marmotae TaxID=2663857 RepID=A0A6I3JGG9_9ACTN|nr:3-dehydroquinate synthase [Nocardioides marmotae]MCR6033778.1 3-dehydroquinate synthase [Gordonia jinghuaiqii]MBC9733603.1 3-dehydroquinate synthase [Nocardioides marmotae]MTB84707.1 3-dehydroquinate synthase [Nocardioides marmotae]MTB97436.1 3-dehydroquinate synthase [Nocardioides marmotae]QKE01745.1 3-dehydroquinate synthase [Nocardioides marmotae]